MGLEKEEKGSGFGCCWGCGGGGEVAVKLKPLKASFMSPKFDCCWAGGDCMPPKEFWDLVCGLEGGAEAYKERIDCLRSGREGPVVVTGVDATLDGLPEEVGGGPPKKSSPNNESAGFDCLDGAAFLGGGGRPPATSVVLGLTGGAGTSPNRSTSGVALGIGGGG